MNKLKVIFMGTPDFSVPCLAKLCANHEVIAVFTQPDRPKGRGQKLMPPPVKSFAVEAKIPVYQPEKIKKPEVEKLIADMQADVIVVVAFGQILSKPILSAARLGCINVHASLLPRYRGAAPIHWAVMNGESVTGVTTMFMNEGLDTGDMILKDEIPIDSAMNTGQLHDLLMNSGAELLIKTLELLSEGRAPRLSQDDSQANYAPLLKKAVERIDWQDSALNIHNKIRGLNPWPGSYCLFNEKPFKLWQSYVVADDEQNTEPGLVTAVTKQGFIVAAGTGKLEIVELQPAGKRRMSAHDYVCGHGIAVGDKLE